MSLPEKISADYMPEPGNAPAFDPVIFAYTRAQAIEDGVLVDVSDTAREAGFKIPVALSRSVWDRLVALPEGYRGFQDERGRLWDVLWMARPLRAPRFRQQPRDHVRARARHPQGSPRQQPAAPQALPHRGDRRRRRRQLGHHRDVSRGTTKRASAPLRPAAPIQGSNDHADSQPRAEARNRPPRPRDLRPPEALAPGRVGAATTTAT